MESMFQYQDFTFRLYGEFTLSNEKLVAATKAVAGAFIDYGGLAKSRVRQILVEKWERDYAMADVRLWEGWQPIWCKPGDEYQAVYQLAHELGHVAMGHDKRFSQADNHQWIDEILCGACSLHATAYAGENWNGDEATRTKFHEQAETLKLVEFPGDSVRDVPIPVDEFEKLVATSGFAVEMRPYAGRLFSMIGGPAIVADLPGLAEVPAGLTCDVFLDMWQAYCGNGGRTPCAFRDMIAPRQ